MYRAGGGVGSGAVVSGTTNAVYVPAGIGAISAIPFIHLSSGSVSAAGAISAITALPLIYPSAYCWFPANALATVKAAGWYYCTFSGLTAGTAFLDSYTSGAPIIPASPQAVIDGKGAFTSDTSGHNGPTISAPAGSLGVNGQLQIESDWQFTNSAGNKTLGLAFGASTLMANVLTTQVGAMALVRVANTGIATKQIQRGSIVLSSSAVTINGASLGTVDTTAAVSVVFTLTKAAAADNLILERYSIEVLYSA